MIRLPEHLPRLIISLPGWCKGPTCQPASEVPAKTGVIGLRVTDKISRFVIILVISGGIVGKVEG